MPIQTLHLDATDRSDMLVLASAMVRADDRPKLMAQLFCAGLLRMGFTGWVLKARAFVLGEASVRTFFRRFEQRHPTAAAQIHAELIEFIMGEKIIQAQVDRILERVHLPALERLTKFRPAYHGR